ncbi:helix-turn-helix domain-containing protein [Gloeocapsopsis dulcis]|uniref:Uncharacterized protein n=1 Tax=Gloeocapsopsis dulcis AAB1 = 1H9 TaxID=1433147 RepID=A0A6N8G1K2_9CHRO|nr:helix-turn-helix domain-containing protein [Gloeocapsopsis dulcis]MUL38969.1 hypothetical protein [Gloeocapsopsis dulcis AAB1 = 1H9]WNN89538.1 helix-turn-helix domain-containing protein [Gloeocapsopsis dulcis]
MPKRLTLAPHLNLEELEHRYRQATNVTESRHCQVILLLAKGWKSEAVAAVTGYTRTRIYGLVKAYNDHGAEALGDRRQLNSGAPTLINDFQQAQLWQVLQSKSSDEKLWNGREVADYLSELTGKRVSRQRGWEILRRMNFLQASRQQKQWKKARKQNRCPQTK